MNLQEIKERIEFLKEQAIAEVELERGDVKLRIKRAPNSSAPAQDTRTIAVQAASSIPENAVAQPIASPAVPGTPKESEANGEGPLHTVRSPIDGTFYESPSPGSPPFVTPGDAVEHGQVLRITDAKKLMNEIESDVDEEGSKK